MPGLLVAPDPQIHYGGETMITHDAVQDVPQQVCLSFVAPLVNEAAHLSNTDVARMGFHSVMIGQTVITLSRFVIKRTKVSLLLPASDVYRPTLIDSSLPGVPIAPDEAQLA